MKEKDPLKKMKEKDPFRIIFSKYVNKEKYWKEKDKIILSVLKELNILKNKEKIKDAISLGIEKAMDKALKKYRAEEFWLKLLDRMIVDDPQNYDYIFDFPEKESEIVKTLFNRFARTGIKVMKIKEDSELKEKGGRDVRQYFLRATLQRIVPLWGVKNQKDLEEV